MGTDSIRLLLPHNLPVWPALRFARPAPILQPVSLAKLATFSMVEQDVEPAAHLANTKTLELVNYVILTVPHVSHPPQIACPVVCLEEIRPT